MERNKKGKDRAEPQSQDAARASSPAKDLYERLVRRGNAARVASASSDLSLYSVLPSHLSAVPIDEIKKKIAETQDEFRAYKAAKEGVRTSAQAANSHVDETDLGAQGERSAHVATDADHDLKGKAVDPVNRDFTRDSSCPGDPLSDTPPDPSQMTADEIATYKENLREAIQLRRRKLREAVHNVITLDFEVRDLAAELARMERGG
ncbi:hypothetical protein QBC47DRAFT_407813 [Echria macrotheca]|uniref:Uncharacterized protein n=1 Tax=Echria macrotheca TaxID=438768 RepID=A0AAJ0F008_9PEZI|nr:hypothetical protein QBC47DRAFT_407813 [Echria macrotheca]